jgi:NADP-dependent 3-hydroxy acid dehydrogenase YdfG
LIHRNNRTPNEIIQINACRVDVSDRKRVYRFADEEVDDFGKVDIVMAEGHIPVIVRNPV